jgi:hypothetical protein
MTKDSGPNGNKHSPNLVCSLSNKKTKWNHNYCSKYLHDILHDFGSLPISYNINPILTRWIPDNCLTNSMCNNLLEKLLVAHLVKKFSERYETYRFITVSTRARHWSVSCARLIHSTLQHSVSLLLV